jgi:hypothetical protein
LFAGRCSNAYAGIYVDITTTKDVNTHTSVKNNTRKKIEGSF